MTREDWINYFEAVNGRSPEPAEIQQALAAGDFQEEASVPNPDLSAGTLGQGSGEVKTAYQQDPGQAPIYSNQSAQWQASQPVYQGPVKEQENYSQYYHNEAGQPLYHAQVAPPQGTSFLGQYWAWLVSAWKAPTSEFPTHRYYGLLTLGLLSLFPILITISKNPFLNQLYSAYLEVAEYLWFFKYLLVAFLIHFSIVLGGFIIKQAVYRDSAFTFSKSLEYYGRLFAPNILILGLASLFNLFHGYLVGSVLVLVSNAWYLFASCFSLCHSKTKSSLDAFYAFILSLFLLSVVVTLVAILIILIAGFESYNYLIFF